MTQDPAKLFALKRPCGDCPFRVGNPLGLGHDRALEIEASLTERPFFCHKTTTAKRVSTLHPDARYCAGAMLYSLKRGQWGPHMLLGVAARVFDPGQLDTTAQVFDTPESLAAHHARWD